MHVESLGVAHVVGAPDTVDELHPGQHAPRVAEQNLEQLKLLERQLHLLAADGHDMPVDVHPDRTRLHDRADRLTDVAAAAQHCPHPGDQLAGRERLGHVVVRPQLQADDLVDLTVLRSQHDHGYVGPLPQAPAHLAARQTGQHEVKQHQVGAGAVEGLDGVGAGRADCDLESLLAQHVGQRVAEGFLILDNEHPSHLTASLTAGEAAGSVRASLS